jgi:signal transduction histidine kinase
VTIRSRLTWAYGIGVAATLVLVGLLVWWQMSDTLVRSLEMALQTRASGILASLENQGQAGLQDPDQAAPGIWAVLLDAHGRPIDASPVAPAEVPAVPGTFTADGSQYLLRVDQAQDGTIVITGADMAPVAAAQAALARIFLGVGLSVGTASLVVGWILAGRALRPIDRLIADADELGPDDLGRRLAPPRNNDEVGRLALTLNGMLDRISESVARQQLFVAMASHELRTPLAALRGELDLADHEGARISDYRAAIRAAQADAVRLSTLTASLLELATVGDEAHPLVRIPLSIKALAASSLRTVAPLAEQSSARLTADVPDQIVWVDRGRVEQALVNMLANAIVHSTERPDVELRAELSRPPAAPMLTLTVLDRGPGFGTNDPAEMFTPFRRGEGARAQGSGLGLAMVAAAARAHGGSFGAADRVGGGAIVWLEIPSVPPAEPPTLQLAPTTADWLRPTREPAATRRDR